MPTNNSIFFIRKLFTLGVAAICLVSQFAFASAPERPKIPRQIEKRLRDNRVSLDGIRRLSTTESNEVFKVVEFLLSESVRGGAKEDISGFKITNFMNEVRTTQLFVNESSQPIYGSNQRLGSVNIPEEKTVIFNRDLLSSLTGNTGAFQAIGAGVETMFIHEFLGALGYGDSDYSLSLYLWMRTFPGDYGTEVLSLWEHWLERERSDIFKDQLPFDMSSSGTSTGVGGGGDPAALSIKIMAATILGQQKDLVLKALAVSSMTFEDLVSAFIRTPIENQLVAGGRQLLVEVSIDSQSARRCIAKVNSMEVGQIRKNVSTYHIALSFLDRLVDLKCQK
jgi:hypothetical protein